jgi:hypothetical protein
MSKQIEVLAYDYKTADGKKVKVEGSVEYEEAAKRFVLKSGTHTLGYFYPDTGETKDRSLNTVGKGNLLAGLLLLAKADEQRKQRVK